MKTHVKSPMSTINPISATLLPGETPLPSAPAVVLDDGTNCIPQHFLSYQHTLKSVADIIAETHFDSKYVLFVDQDHGGIFIQIGIIGKDNYQPLEDQNAEKIVYGRRWRVEPQLPSSEIIQTAFLAILKAREHEVRELFKYKNAYQRVDNVTNAIKYHTTTPFSCHHDLPLIAMSRATNTESNEEPLSEACLAKAIEKVSYDYCSFKLNEVLMLSHEQVLIKLQVTKNNKTKLPEMQSLKDIQSIYFIVNELTENAVMYGLMDHLLSLSNRHVEENFTFKGFARFSRKQSVQRISALSAKTRVSVELNQDFANAFSHANYETDETRVPRINQGKLGDKITQQLKVHDIKFGILPKYS